MATNNLISRICSVSRSRTAHKVSWSSSRKPEPEKLELNQQYSIEYLDLIKYFSTFRIDSFVGILINILHTQTSQLRLVKESSLGHKQEGVVGPEITLQELDARHL